MKGLTPTQVVEQWLPRVHDLESKWPSLVVFENDLASKVGPLSIQKPLAQRLEDIESYYDSILLESSPLDTSAIAAVTREWTQVRGLQIRGQTNTVLRMRKSTNSGAPYFSPKRKLVVKETLPNALSYNGDEPYYTIGPNYDEYNACAVLGWRGQEGGPNFDDVKQRVIWMFPFGINIEELQVYQPLIEGAQRFGLVPAWIGIDAVDAEITKLFDTKGENDPVVCTDFTKFDQHFNHSLQACAHDLLAQILSQGEDGRWLSDVFPVKYNIPLMFDYGRILEGPHGMGSGSGGTNADETLAHRALQYEAAQRKGSRLNLHSMCLGDDGVLSYPGIDVEQVVDTYTAHGQVMNIDKQYISTTDCVYLRRWYHTNYRPSGICRGVYSTSRALGRLCEQERFYDPGVWGPKMVALRQLSIIENCKWHPLRDEFVEFCMKGDIYRLGIDIPGFLDNIESYAQEAIDYMPDFLGYTRSLSGNVASGISSWWIVNYLKSKA